LRDRLMNIARTTLDGQTLIPTLNIDLEVDIHELTDDLARELQLLEPCGHGNPLPIFVSRNVHVAEYRPVGKDERHLKLKFSRAGQPSLNAIGFGLGEWVDKMPQRVDIAYHLEINEWQGRQSLQANLQDLCPAHEAG
jgi:single-stranded-DNA-specific exonuclease